MAARSTSSRCTRAARLDGSRRCRSHASYVDGAIGSTAQIGSTPETWRCSSMNDTGTQEDTERSSAAAARNAAPFPPSPPACRTHLRSVSAVQPSFVAMAQMVAHSDAWSSRAYRTSRTARSRTSGESFCLVSLMTPTLSTTGVSGKTGAVHLAALSPWRVFADILMAARVYE
jgi:hypothetical protein